MVLASARQRRPSRESVSSVKVQHSEDSLTAFQDVPRTIPPLARRDEISLLRDVTGHTKFLGTSLTPLVIRF